jgi:hypothetical protein
MANLTFKIEYNYCTLDCCDVCSATVYNEQGKEIGSLYCVESFGDKFPEQNLDSIMNHSKFIRYKKALPSR